MAVNLDEIKRGVTAISHGHNPVGQSMEASLMRTLLQQQQVKNRALNGRRKVRGEHPQLNQVREMLSTMPPEALESLSGMMGQMGLAKNKKQKQQVAELIEEAAARHTTVAIPVQPTEAEVKRVNTIQNLSVRKMKKKQKERQKKAQRKAIQQGKQKKKETFQDDVKMGRDTSF